MVVKTNRKVILGVVASLVVLGAIAAYTVSNMENDHNSGLKPRGDIPLNGEYILTGNSTVNGTEYYSCAKFVFKDGTMIDSKIQTDPNKGIIPSGVTTYKSSMKYMNMLISPDVSQSYYPDTMSLHDSLVYHNPFLKEMTHGDCGYITVDGSPTEVHAFDSKDFDGTFYLDKNGNLVAYKYQYQKTDFLAILAQ